MSGEVWERRTAVVNARLRDDGYVEQRVIDKQGDEFALILRPASDTVVRVLLLVDAGIDHDVASRGFGDVVVTVTLPKGSEVVRYGRFVGAP